MLAADAHLFPGDDILPGDHPVPPHTRGLPRHLLAGYEQLHVQPYHILLDEFQVSTKERMLDEFHV